MTGPRVAVAVLRKDLLLDLRSRDRMGHMLVFAALVIVLLSIVLPDVDARTRAWIPALVWIVFLFTSLLGLGRSFQAENEDGARILLAQAPGDRGWVGLGKVAANWLTLLVIELWTGLLCAVFLDVSWSGAILTVLGIGALGAGGLAGVGTLLSAMASSARFREFLLPLLLFPLILPVLVLASRMTAAALAGDPVSFGYLALYDWVFILLTYFVFDYLMED
ncbi:MAG: heme exporter protein CcmB [Myxococcota bacterium]